MKTNLEINKKAFCFYVGELSKLHVKLGNFVEAGVAEMMYNEVLKWSDNKLTVSSKDDEENETVLEKTKKVFLFVNYLQYYIFVIFLIYKLTINYKLIITLL